MGGVQSAEKGAAGPGADVAWVESPLQLLAAAELATATGRRPHVAFRLTGAHMTETAAELQRRGAPFASCAPYLGIPWGLLSRHGDWAIGDGLSGQFRAAVSVLRPRAITLLDDGEQTLHLADAVVGEVAFARQGVAESRLARALGLVAGERLRALAARDRLHAFTMYAERVALARLAGLGASVTPNRFAFSRATARPLALTAGRVLLGSALVVDRRMPADEYLGWVAAVAGEGSASAPTGSSSLAYLPHRREPAGVLEEVGRIPGVDVIRTGGLPVEMLLAGTERRLEIVSLPSSALTGLEAVLGRPITARPVPSRA